MFNSVSFDLEIVTRNKNLRTVDISKILLYLRTIFIYSKVTSAEITDHCGKKHHYCDGEFPKSTQSSICPDESYGSLMWKGSVDLKSNQIGDLIKNLSPIGHVNDESYGYFWKFDERYSEFNQTLGSTSFKSKLSRDPSHFTFGNIITGNCFVSHFTSHLNSQIKDLEVELAPHKSELNLTFTVIRVKAIGNQNERKVKLNFDCNSIKSAIIHHVDPLGFSFYADLAYAPKMFIAEDLFSGKGKQQTRWKRVNSYGPISQNVLGNCNVLRLTWFADDTSYIPALYYWRRHLKFDLSFGTILLDKYSVLNESKTYEFPDKIQYALACIKSLGYNYQDDLQIKYQGERIINEFIQKQINNGKCDQVYRALNYLFDELNNGKVYNVFEHLKHLLNKVELEWELIKDDEQDTEQIKYIKTVVFTPSRTIFMPPVMTRTCKFLDMVESDHVLRVIYRDENNGPLGSTFKNFGSSEKKECAQDENINCVTSMLKHRILPSGLFVAGRTYQYYGASPSQLKDGGMILYSKDSQNRTASSIRDSLGIVKEKTVPKYMARIGLSLSQVMAFVDLPEYTNIYLTSDIYGLSSVNDKLHNFTDGCGSISIEAARYVYKDLIRQNVMKAKDDDNYVPSAFQIRFMGSKGMLVVDPELVGMAIVIRESMHKMYTKKEYRIGIVKLSEPRKAFLNKPFIMILNQIGLSNDFFINFTLSTLRDLNSSLYDEHVALMTMKIYSYLHRIVNLDTFAKCNFSFTSDSFFTSILNLAVKQAIDNLITKQRIPLPWLEARTMLGVCDTTAKSKKWLADEFVKQGIVQPPKLPVNAESLGTGVLKSGQVFCWPSDFSEPIRGEVIITKFPTSDLGGVRKLFAVDCKELHNIRDCIVFPVDGKRPHQDEMAGSDLDGDEYCVIWMEDFLSIKTQIATEYPDNPQVQISEEISDEAMLEHHIKCVETDQVGQLSNAQLAHADSKGYDSTVCKSIGAKYNGALDAPKNGINSKYFLGNKEQALEFPDFMDKCSTKPTYFSTSASGDIHRLVNLSQLTFISSNMLAVFEPSSDIDERLLHPNMLKYIKFASEILQFYESTINQLLTRHGLKLEIELLTGIFYGPCSLRYEASRAKDKEDAMVATIYSLLINKMNKRFDSKMVNASEDDKMACASAIYYVSKQKFKDGNSVGLPFIGSCGFHLRRYMESQQITRKIKDKVSTKNAILPHNQHTIRSAIQKMKIIVDTFSSYSKQISRKALKVSSQIDEIGNSLIAVSDSQENQIATLIEKIKNICSNLVGIENHRLSQIPFIESTIPPLIWSLMVNENYLQKSDYVNESCLVRYCKRGSHKKLWKLLEITLAPDTQIQILANSKEKNCIPIVIFGSPTSIWLAKTLIGIHNRILSIYFNYET